MKIVILTGAGLSAESGLGTFRDKGGIWAEYDLDEVASVAGFARDPGKVHGFYNLRRANCAAAAPNAAHGALARLQAAPAHDTLIVTQNVDDLHKRAGSDPVLAMHGEVMRALCASCGHRWDAPVAMQPDDPCPACGRRATRPDIVWFGEIPYHMDKIARAIAACDLFVAIGTSGQVWPAAGFVDLAREAGADRLEINLEATEISARFADTRTGPATRTVPEWVGEMIGPSF